MGPNDALASYLDDHLAGAAAGVELARRVAVSHAGTLAEGFLRGLADDVEADREALREVRDGLGLERSYLKEAAGWVGEKLTRLKLSEVTTGDRELGRLLELETLSLGIA